MRGSSVRGGVEAWHRVLAREPPRAESGDPSAPAPTGSPSDAGSASRRAPALSVG